MNADGGEIAQLTSSGFVRAPVCSGDSQKAYFNIGNDVNVSLWSVPVVGGSPKLLLPPDNYCFSGFDNKNSASFPRIWPQDISSLLFLSIRVWRKCRRYRREVALS
jgi:hypothetical protein